MLYIFKSSLNRPNFSRYFLRFKFSVQRKYKKIVLKCLHVVTFSAKKECIPVARDYQSRIFLKSYNSYFWKRIAPLRWREKSIRIKWVFAFYCISKIEANEHLKAEENTPEKSQVTRRLFSILERNCILLEFSVFTAFLSYVSYRNNLHG